MLAPFAVTPGAFGVENASSPNALSMGIGCLNDLCNAEGLFLDLRDGGWGRVLEGMSREAREFRRYAHKRRRLIPAAAQLADEPSADEEWLWEAQKYHARTPCRALITHERLAAEYGDQPEVVSLERINRTGWWAERSPSREVPRNTRAYLESLGLVLRHANLLMFIDPYIDPLASNYAEFPLLLQAAGSACEQPVIQIHRASWRRSRGQNEVQPLGRWRADFQPWSDLLARAGRKAEVFLWADIHDRHLVSDILAINLPYGFDIGDGKGAPTTWSRLGQRDQERLQREYEPNCPLHGFVGRFEIGAD